MTAQVSDRTPFTIAISKGSGLVRESRLLLEAWEPDEPVDAFIARVGQSDLLGRATAQRTDDIIRRVFAKRFLEPTPSPAPRMKRLLAQRSFGRWFPELCSLHASRADETLRCSITDAYGAAVRDGGSSLGVGEIESYLRDAEADGRMAQPWSPEVRRKVARGLLQAMQDFGLLDEVRRGHREIRLPDPHAVTTAYVAYDLHERGVTDADITAHEDWRLWAQSVQEVRRRLDRLTETGLWVFQAAGSVVRITWAHETLDEALDAVARLDVR